MAVAGVSPIPKSTKFDIPWPDKLSRKRVVLLWRANPNGEVVAVGFKGQTGKLRRDGSGLTLVEEWFEKRPFWNDMTPEEAVKKLVHERVAELFAKSENVIPEPVEEEEIPDDILAPSVEPLGPTGEPKLKGRPRKKVEEPA